MSNNPSTVASLIIRPPRQRRSREAWARILETGIELLEAGGYEAFTISAICERASVAPSAVYDRADSKDALFLAVFEHALRRLRADYDAFDWGPSWEGLALAETIHLAVGQLSEHFANHVALLRSIILISGAHGEVHRRGVDARYDLAARFTRLLTRAATENGVVIDHDAAQGAFAMLFSTLSMRTAYGSGFTHLPDNDAAFTEQLASMTSTYLLAGARPAERATPSPPPAVDGGR